ncbi:MAG: A24 family peptidase [Pseudomonadota bacterium]
MAAYFAQAPWLFYVMVFAFSLLVGSFLNVVIYRLPKMMEMAWDEQLAELAAEKSGESLETKSEQKETFNLSKPRSACPHCGHQIRWYENIPVISWLFLRGKCSNCQARISIRYPLVELSTALLSLLVALRFGIGYETLVGVGLTWTLVALSGIDIDTQLLPDNITLPLVWAGLVVSLFPQPDATTLFVDPRTAIIGAIAGYLSLWSVFQLFKIVTGKEGMGYGDFKLLAALGAFLGWQKLPLIVMLSAVVGAVYGVAMIALSKQKQGQPMPFGPWLAAAGFIAMLYGDDLINAYLSFSGLN